MLAPKDLDIFGGDVLEQAVDKVMDALKKAESRNNPHKNIIDPFNAVFEAASLDTSLEDWLPLEVRRQTNKTLSNAVGAFHQELLGRLPGWQSTGAAGGRFDLIHPEPFGKTGKPAFAEVKNKFNTMNSSSRENLFQTFIDAQKFKEYKGATFYLIEVIQKVIEDDVPWKVSNRAKEENIRVISARKVYELSTGDPDAFEKTYKAINRILSIKYGLQLPASDDDLSLDLYRRAFLR
ncbi:Eco47II family restriction endonuclease [Leucobacter sp. OH1287]|uniref:Eco47II family restriction endonuclease n=1 Tax=Leucobacter sp. OH1287 TaxID=2491049 RepID=UPI000F5DD7E2|nr:Eco47II family restriction endonuclease [Leucobacter sp. OH1287]RRD61185.1 Eco47II family restriction endonuclease [Leucobacter sp. OH1287]